ncbi:MAG: isoleucine--tRNA ligase [Elusimicrobiales bacterium]
MDKTENKSFSNTVFLPKTSFSMKANLVQKEPQIIDLWSKIDVYKRMIEKNSSAPVYFLHDGPPYANGHIHIGHALNKILKDFVVKSYSLMGYQTPYIPGWDCHGLPIEQQLLKELKISKRHINDVVSFRKKAREFAERFIKIQRDEFKRLGVFGDWENPYITMSNEYESGVVKAFLNLFYKGYIERDKKTIYWCAVCETALAEAEVEYKEKTSPSIYVRFKVIESKLNYTNLYLVVWTTTPWTLPANMAVAVNENEDYLVIEVSDGHLVVAEKLLEDFVKNTSISASVITKLKGIELENTLYEAPFSDMLDKSQRYPRRVIFSNFVDMTSGSGMVHIAPGHGEEDYFAGKKWGLEVFCPVDERGRFTSEIKALEDRFVFDANTQIIEILRNKNLLINSSTISHSYPHCWRCKNPIIFRATEQWFLKIDKNSLRDDLLRECLNVKWLPTQGYDRITSMIKIRPDWCLSRQRYWGTPIIAFWCKRCRRIVNDSQILNSIAERIRKQGSDFWFFEDAKKILGDYKCECGSSDFEKEKDILDVWFDSGVSWHNVCVEKATYPADLYLEGSDQHRGWFQTSLIPSVALNSKAPYKTVLTHGFVLDEYGKAMHKSLGNVVSPQDVISKYGAEILRLWVSLSDWKQDIRISDALLSVPVDLYRKIRNTFRYLLGNLADFKPDKRIVYSEMENIDRYILSRFSRLTNDVKKDWQEFEYRDAIRKIADFCIIDLSSFYLDVLKDRLYTYSLNSRERRSAQTAMYDMLKGLCILTAPILSFTSEEVWQTLKKEIDHSLSESVFLNRIDEIIAPCFDESVENKYLRILSIREHVLKEIEKIRKESIIGSSLEAKIIITADGDMYDFVSKNIDEIIAACIVSQGEVKRGEFSVKAVKADGSKCPRCWQWRVDIGVDKAYAEVCAKCAKALRENASNT